MDDELFETPTFLELTGLSGRSQSRYVSAGYLSEEERGGGRGKRSKFKIESAIWARGLTQILAAWPTLDPARDVRVYLTKPGRKRNIWVRLSNGRTIINYIHSMKNVMERYDFAEIRYGIAALLIAGRTGNINNPTGGRYGDVMLVSLIDATALLDRLLNPRAIRVNPLLTGPSEHLLSSVTVINLNMEYQRLLMRKRQILG